MSATSTITLDNFSPTIRYTPLVVDSGTADLFLGWNSFFTGSGFPTDASLGSVGNGSSQHVTSLEGAQLTISWTGTSISLFGATNSSYYDVALDGQLQPSTREGAVLAQFSDLPFGPHSITLTLHTLLASNESTLSFAYADLSIANPSMNSTPAQTTIPASQLTLNGMWTPSDISLSSDSAPPVYVSESAGDEATLDFNGTAIQVFGVSTPNAGSYNVTLDGTSSIFNLQSPWTVRTTLFFESDLASSAPHQLTITNTDGSELILDTISVTGSMVLSSMQSSPAPTNTVSGKLPEGTIIALSIAGAITVVLISILGFLVWRYYRRTRRRRPPKTQKNFDTGSDFFDPPKTHSRAGPSIEFPRPIFAVPPSAGGSSSASGDAHIWSSHPSRPPIPLFSGKGAQDSSSSSRSLSRRTYLRSLNSLHQEYLYDERDRDDVHINNGNDPDAGYQDYDAVPDEKLMDSDFVIDAETVFAALSRSRGTSPQQQPDHLRLPRKKRSGLINSFLDMETPSSSNRANSTRSGTVQSSLETASASIPYFTPASPNQKARSELRNSLQSTTYSTYSAPQSTPYNIQTLELSHSHPRSGLIRMSFIMDEPLRSPTDSLPRTISPGPSTNRDRTQLTDPQSPKPNSKSDSSQSQSAPSDAYVSANSQPRGSDDPDANLTVARSSSPIPSGHSGTGNVRPDSPVPSSINIRPQDRRLSRDTVLAAPSPPAPVLRVPPRPRSPPQGLPPPLPHPFAVAESPRPATPPTLLEPPVPSTTPSSSRNTRTSPPPSPFLWPASTPTRSQSERALRKLLGDDVPLDDIRRSRSPHDDLSPI